MKFLVLLTISAASAVTVYRSEDSMAMETRTHQRGISEEGAEDQEPASLTIYPKQERLKQAEDQQRFAGYTRQERSKPNTDDRERYTGYPKQERFRQNLDDHLGYVKQERVKNGEDQQHHSIFVKHERVKNEDQQHHGKYERVKQNGEDQQHATGFVKHERVKQTGEDQQRYAGYPKRVKEDQAKRPKKYNAEQNQQQFFENINEQDGLKMGYSSFVQHQDEGDASGQGSKSSIQFEMYHGPEQITKKPVVKETGLGKLKNKPKIYQDALNNYKKSKNSFPGSSSNSPILVKDLPSSTPNFAPSQPKFQPSFPKRRPYNKRPEPDAQFQAAESSATKSEAQPTSHSESNLGAQSKYGQHLSQRYLKQKPDTTTQKSTIVHHVHGKTESPLYEIRGSRWTALSDGVEIATSEEVKPKSKRSRHQKEIHSGLFSTHGQFPEPHHFDHEKALRSSTSFGVGNVMFGSEPEENVHQTVLEGGSAFNIAHTYDIAKAVEAQTIGAAQGPIQFGTELGHKRIPKNNMVNAGSFEIPVMTEDEFERHFGKYRQEAKKPYRPVQRVPFDARPKQSPQLKQQALSFSQFNGNVWAQSQNAPSVKQYPNVDTFPSLSYLAASRRNVSLVPERLGRVLNEDSSEPQQFSVSASYQIDRNHGAF